MSTVLIVRAFWNVTLFG